jgi:hypothetical protein
MNRRSEWPLLEQSRENTILSLGGSRGILGPPRPHFDPTAAVEPLDGSAVHYGLADKPVGGKRGTVPR